MADRRTRGLDAITTEVLFALAKRHPGKAIHLTHQFLDGRDGQECGCVPDPWDGGVVTVAGQWWRIDYATHRR